MANDSVEQLNSNGNKRGNPAWVKGKSANPRGRPIGQTRLAAFSEDPDRFFFRHYRWYRFVYGLTEPPYTGAVAARRAGYSPRSARFIASRLLRKPVIRAMRKRQNELVDKACKQGHWP